MTTIAIVGAGRGLGAAARLQDGRRPDDRRRHPPRVRPRRRHLEHPGVGRLMDWLSALPACTVPAVVAVVLAAESGLLIGLVLPGSSLVVGVGVLAGAGLVRPRPRRRQRPDRRAVTAAAAPGQPCSGSASSANSR
jgi:hypothetical protein